MPSKGCIWLPWNVRTIAICNSKSICLGSTLNPSLLNSIHSVIKWSSLFNSKAKKPSESCCSSFPTSGCTLERKILPHTGTCRFSEKRPRLGQKKSNTSLNHFFISQCCDEVVQSLLAMKYNMPQIFVERSCDTIEILKGLRSRYFRCSMAKEMRDRCSMRAIKCKNSGS